MAGHRRESERERAHWWLSARQSADASPSATGPKRFRVQNAAVSCRINNARPTEVRLETSTAEIVTVGGETLSVQNPFPSVEADPNVDSDKGI